MGGHSKERERKKYVDMVKKQKERGSEMRVRAEKCKRGKELIS